MRLERQRGPVMQGLEVCGEKLGFYPKCFQEFEARK